LKPAHARHFRVEQNQIGDDFVGEPQRIPAVRGEPQSRHASEEAAQQLDGAGVIVDEQNLLRLRGRRHEQGIQPQGERAFCEARHGPHQELRMDRKGA
jgi:hypothetical protein